MARRKEDPEAKNDAEDSLEVKNDIVIIDADEVPVVDTTNVDEEVGD